MACTAAASAAITAAVLLLFVVFSLLYTANSEKEDEGSWVCFWSLEKEKDNRSRLVGPQRFRSYLGISKLACGSTLAAFIAGAAAATAAATAAAATTTTGVVVEAAIEAVLVVAPAAAAAQVV